MTSVASIVVPFLLPCTSTLSFTWNVRAGQRVAVVPNPRAVRLTTTGVVVPTVIWFAEQFFEATLPSSSVWLPSVVVVLVELAELPCTLTVMRI